MARPTLPVIAHPPTVLLRRTLLLRWPAGRVPGLFDRCIGPRNTTIDESTGFTAMANIKSQKKRILTNEKRHERNKSVKAEVKTRTKRVEATLGTDDNTEAVRAAVKRIDSAASKGIIHKNKASRTKSRLSAQIKALAAA